MTLVQFLIHILWLKIYRAAHYLQIYGKNRIKMRDTERLLASYTDKLVKAKKLRKHYTMQTLRHAL